MCSSTCFSLSSPSQTPHPSFRKSYRLAPRHGNCSPCGSRHLCPASSLSPASGGHLLQIQCKLSPAAAKTYSDPGVPGTEALQHWSHHFEGVLKYYLHETPTPLTGCRRQRPTDLSRWMRTISDTPQALVLPGREATLSGGTRSPIAPGDVPTYCLRELWESNEPLGEL